MTRMSGVLLDLSGVVFSGGAAIGDAVAAVADLRAHGIALRFVTNTTSEPLRVLRETLQGLGIAASDEHVFTPATAARGLVREHGWSPHFLMNPALLEDFDPPSGTDPNAVIVGDAGRAFTFDALNAAFRLIDGGAAFIALARNRTFRDDGALSLDAGPFVAALEYASRREALLIGKPAAAFYESALADLGTPAASTVMIGDDAESDVEGAMAAGMAGILVRTGKYRDGDETRIKPAPTATLADLREAVDWVLERR